jgi:phosphoribosylformylglycinamidine (FGAM) synthase PurS component
LQGIEIIHTIEVIDKPTGDSVSELEKALRGVGIKEAKAFSTTYYSLSDDLSPKKIEEITKLVYHEVTQDILVDEPYKGREWDFAIRADYKPGVTDNSARVLKSDLILIGVDCDVYTSNVHYVRGEYDNSLRDMLERVASNPQIHDISILTKREFDEQNGFERRIHPVVLPERPNFFWIDLGSMSREEVLRTGDLGTLNLDLVKQGMTQKEIDHLRGGILALEADYMYSIMNYAKSELNTQAGR